jgi:hypothetical protein
MEPLEAYRIVAVALDEWACGYDKGRPKTDPVYQEVVEKRDVPATYEHYSSCADRAHWRLWRLGCRLPFVNREERSPLPNDWHIGMNISLLHDTAKGSPALSKVIGGSRYAVPPAGDWVPSPGDEMIVWNTGKDAHSLAVLEWDGKIARTSNYGVGGMTPTPSPGAKIIKAPLTFDGQVWKYGLTTIKTVQRVIRLEDVIPTLTVQANLMGPDFTDAYTSKVWDLIMAFNSPTATQPSSSG